MAFWKKKDNSDDDKCPLCSTIVSIDDTECSLCFYELKLSPRHQSLNITATEEDSLIGLLNAEVEDEVDEEKYQEAFEQIRQNLLNTERNRGYNSWLTEARKAIKKDDYRSEVY